MQHICTQFCKIISCEPYFYNLALQLTLMNKYFLLLLTFWVYTANAQEHLSSGRSDVDETLAPFYHGVASGDPLEDRVILWTRVTTQDPTVNVTWQIATDTGFTNVVNSGNASTNASNDFTVKVDADNLQPNTWYYYRFTHNGKNSPTGRTRTAPVSGVTNLRFAVVSCSNYQSGYFNAYKDIALKNDVDAVIHLGDYFYEYGATGSDPNRLHEPETEILSLADYRMRHSQYKLDPDLRHVHQLYPFIAVWDDHETANNSWMDGAENHTEGTEGAWGDRKFYGQKSYFEWMPIRDIHNSVDTIHRRIPYSNLVDLLMIDTRLQGRQEQIGTTGAAVTDTNRTLLGYTQRDWLIQQLSNSTAQWKIIGNQVMMSPLSAPIIGLVNDDQWDGYPAERAKILSHVRDNNINNVVVLTGDIHTSWANDLPVSMSSYTGSTGAGSVALEFVCTSVTSSSGLPSALTGLGLSVIQQFNPNIKYAELTRRGYVLLDATPQRIQSDWVYMSSIASRSFTSNTAASWCSNDGANRLVACGSPLTPRNNLPTAPEFITGINTLNRQEVVVISVFPNPFDKEVAVQFYTEKPSPVELQITDMNGKVVATQTLRPTENGLFNMKQDLSALPAGTYQASLISNGKVHTRQVVKVK